MNDSNTPPEEYAAGPTDDFDAIFAKRLRAHYRAELDPHVGKATVQLESVLADTARPRRLHIALRWSAAAMLLLGLGVAISLVGDSLRRPAGKQTEVAITASPKPPTDAIVTSWAETYDAGTVLVDPETPARMLRRVQYEKTEWKDASGQWRSAVTSPRQDVILVDIQKQ